MGLEEEPANCVNPAIGIISGFLPKHPPRAQRDADGQTVDTIYAVFVDCNPGILQDEYTEAEIEEKKVSHIPFSDAIKAAKINNYFKVQPSLSHPTTIDFLHGIFEEGYDDSGFLIEAKKTSKTNGKSSQGKVAKCKAEPTSMQKEKKQRQKRHKKQAERDKEKAKKEKVDFNVIFDDDSSYSGKSLYLLPYTPCTMSLSLYSAF